MATTLPKAIWTIYTIVTIDIPPLAETIRQIKADISVSDIE